MRGYVKEYRASRLQVWEPLADVLVRVSFGADYPR